MPFRCLAIETATDLTSLALSCGDRRAWRETAGLKAPSRTIYVLIRELLDELGMRPRDLDCIAFGAGPGSFTGVRVAATVAQGLAAGLARPVFRISTLALLAATAMRVHGAQQVAACLDARMGQAYLGTYRTDPEQGVQALAADRLLDPEALASAGLAGCYGAGPGWQVHRERIGPGCRESLAGIDEGLLPSAQDLLRLAEQGFRCGALVDAPEALPEYLRETVAVPAIRLPGGAGMTGSGAMSPEGR